MADIQTEDGIIIRGWDDSVDPLSSPHLKKFVADIRSTTGAGTYNYTAPTTAEGVAGTLTRELAPTLAGATAGGLIGGIPGAIAGAAAPTLAKFVGDPLVGKINELFGTELVEPSEALTMLFDKLGVASPESEAEKVIASAAKGVNESIPMIATGGAMQVGKTLAPTVTKGIGQALASQPVQQILGGAGAAAGQKIAEQKGAGVVGQTAASLAGGVLGSGLGSMKQPKVKIDTPETQLIQRAEDVGVDLMTSDIKQPQTFPARLGQSLSEKIPVAGTSGLRKTQQAQRVGSVKDILRQYGADDAANISDDIMSDLIKTRSGKINKYSTAKNEVIDKLSGSAEPDLSYRINHQIELEPDATSSLNNITKTIEGGEDLIPDDFFQHPEWYADMSNPQYKESFNVIKSMQGDPNKKVTIYRGVPKDVDNINSGDWISLSKKYALEEAIENNAKVISKEVPAKEIIWDGNDINEFAWFGKGEPVKNVVSMDNTVNAIDSEIAKLSSLNTQEVAPVIAKLNDWKTAVQGQDLKNIELLRKQMGESFKGQDMASVKTTGEKSLTSIYKAINEDMGDYIKTNGDPKDFNKWKVANKELSNLMGELDNSALKRVLNKGEATPELIKNMLFSKKKSDVTALFKQLSPEGKKSAQTAILAKAAESAGEEISPVKFANAVNKLGIQTGVFFQKQDLEQVEGLMRVLEATKRASQSAVTPPTGVQNVIPVGAAALASFFGGGVQGFLGAITAGATAGGLARAYESKAVRDLLVKLPYIAKNSKAEEQIFKRLSEVIRTADNKEGADNA